MNGCSEGGAYVTQGLGMRAMSGRLGTTKVLEVL
jgi:hypothetical protein